jgi:hypothetical protein
MSITSTLVHRAEIRFHAAAEQLHPHVGCFSKPVATTPLQHIETLQRFLIQRLEDSVDPMRGVLRALDRQRVPIVPRGAPWPMEFSPSLQDWWSGGS